MFKIFEKLLKLSYGIIFPFILLYIALTNYAEIQNSIAKEKFKNEMHSKLSYLYDYNRDSVFFNSLLQQKFRLLDNSKSPQKQLPVFIKNLKSQFHNKIKFIVWDNKGRLNKRFSDKQNYKYILKLVYKSIQRLTSMSKDKLHPNIKSLKIIKSKIRLLRKVLGRFLIPFQMLNPIKIGYFGSCLKTSTSDEKGLLWYQSGKNFTIVCFIDESLLNKDLPAKIITQESNQINKKIKIGAINLISRNIYGVDGLSESIKTKIIIESEKYRNSFSPFVETNEALYLFRQPSEELLIFSYLNKKNSFLNVVNYRNIILARLVEFWLILLFILKIYLLRNKFFNFSIKHQLISLFIFVIFLSLLSVVTASYKYFDYKKITLINEVRESSLKTLMQIRNSYSDARLKISDELNQFADNLNKKHKSIKWSSEEIKSFETKAKELLASEIMIVDNSGKCLTFIDKYSVFTNPDSLKMLNSIVLDYSNLIKRKEIEKKYAKVLQNLEYNIVLYDTSIRINKIKLTNLGLKVRWSYLKLLGDVKNYKNWGIAMINWSLTDLQKSFLQREINSINDKYKPLKIIAMVKEDEEIYPQNTNSINVKNILHSCFSQSKIINNDFILNKKHYIALGIAETDKFNASLLALYPKELVENKIYKLKIKAVLATLGLSIMLIFAAWYFLKSLIEPLSTISEGVKRIKNNNFKDKIADLPHDEIGDLGNILNETMDGMNVLSVATAVQKSLLPDRSFKLDKYEIYADSIFMTKMGGDFFDYFMKPNNDLRLLFGDVAGHGIPAGIIMGMIKAVSISSQNDNTSPLDLVKKSNTILKKLRALGWKVAMTFQTIDINSETDTLTVANAGHCYPIIIGNKGESFRYIEVAGTPLGSRVSRYMKEAEDKLERGETLILYSDGIIEAKNSSSEMLGYDRFPLLLQSSWHTNVKEYWSKIYEEYGKWAETQDDDITFMLIRRL